jgi:hypothetical protein
LEVSHAFKHSQVSAQTDQLDVENGGLEDTCEKIDAGLSVLLNKKISLVDESDDSDIGGGVSLPARHAY